MPSVLWSLMALVVAMAVAVSYDLNGYDGEIQLQRALPCLLAIEHLLPVGTAAGKIMARLLQVDEDDD